MKSSVFPVVTILLALSPACRPDGEASLIARWGNTQEEIRFLPDGTFQATTDVGGDSGHYERDDSRLRMVPGGMQALEQPKRFEVTVRRWTLTPCESARPTRCTEYHRLESGTR